MSHFLSEKNFLKNFAYVLTDVSKDDIIQSSILSQSLGEKSKIQENNLGGHL